MKYDAKSKEQKKKCIDGVFAICHNQTKPLIIPQNRILWQDWNFDFFFNPQIAGLKNVNEGGLRFE